MVQWREISYAGETRRLSRYQKNVDFEAPQESPLLGRARPVHYLEIMLGLRVVTIEAG
jgi:hypothetical protein